MDCFSYLSELRPERKRTVELDLPRPTRLIRLESANFLTDFDGLLEDQLSLSDESQMDIRRTQLMAKVHMLGSFERRDAAEVIERGVIG